MANELQLAAGLKLTNPAPADAYYCLPQVGQAPAQPYESPAQACAYVPQPLRYQGLTVNVTGIGEMSWSTADLSNTGLLPKASGSPAPSGVTGFEVRAYSPTQVLLSLPAGLPQTQATLNRITVQRVPKSPKPASYTPPALSASNPTSSGVNFTPASTQKLEINELATVSGSPRSFELIDSSDGSSSQADVYSDYTGQYFRFTRANNTTIETAWPATAQTITL